RRRHLLSKYGALPSLLRNGVFASPSSQSTRQMARLYGNCLHAVPLRRAKLEGRRELASLGRFSWVADFGLEFVGLRTEPRGGQSHYRCAQLATAQNVRGLGGGLDQPASQDHH